MKANALFFPVVILVIFFISLLTRNGDIALLNIIFIGYLAWSIVTSPAKENISFTAERTVQKTICDYGLSVDVKIKLVNRGAKTVSVFAEDPLLPGMKIQKGNLKHCIALKGGTEYNWSYSFSAGRGFYNWNTLSVVVSDPAGCMETAMAIPAAAAIAVPPQYKRLRPIKIAPWETLFTPGIVPSRKSGSSADFFGVREYHPGDPLRMLDWKRTARHRNKYFTKEFQQERTADIAIVVDGRKNRDLTSGDRSIFESMIELAASLCQMFLHQGQRVGFYVAGENPRAVLPAYGKRQLHKILDSMAAAQTGDDGSGDALYTLPLKHFSTKTQLFFLSPVTREDVMYFRSLRSRGVHIFLIRPDTYSFAFPKGFPADVDNISLRLSERERQCVKSMLSNLSVTVIDWIVGEPIQSQLMKALCAPCRVKKG